MPLKLVPSRQGRTPYWYIRGTLYGRTIDASTKATDQKVARRFKERFERELAKEDQQGRSATVSFQAAAELYINYREVRERDKLSIARLIKLIGTYELGDIRQHVLIDAANALYQKGAPATKNRHVITIAASILHYAAENNLCPYMRIRNFKEKDPEPRALRNKLGSL